MKIEVHRIHEKRVGRKITHARLNRGSASETRQTVLDIIAIVETDDAILQHAVVGTLSLPSLVVTIGCYVIDHRAVVQRAGLCSAAGTVRLIAEHQAVVQDSRRRPATVSIKTEISRLIAANDAVVQSPTCGTRAVDRQVEGNNAIGNGFSGRRTINAASA